MTGFTHPSGGDPNPNPSSMETPCSAPSLIKETALSPSTLTLLLDPTKFIGQKQRNGFSKGMERYIQAMNTVEVLRYLGINGVSFALTIILAKVQLK